jgi:hypothetical protein
MMWGKRRGGGGGTKKCINATMACGEKKRGTSDK